MRRTYDGQAQIVKVDRVACGVHGDWFSEIRIERHLQNLSELPKFVALRDSLNPNRGVVHSRLYARQREEALKARLQLTVDIHCAPERVVPQSSDSNQLGVSSLPLRSQLRKEIEQANDMVVVNMTKNHAVKFASAGDHLLLQYASEMILKGAGRTAVNQYETRSGSGAVFHEQAVTEFGLDCMKLEHLRLDGDER